MNSYAAIADLLTEPCNITARWVALDEVRKKYTVVEMGPDNIERPLDWNNVRWLAVCWAASAEADLEQIGSRIVLFASKDEATIACRALDLHDDYIIKVYETINVVHPNGRRK